MTAFVNIDIAHVLRALSLLFLLGTIIALMRRDRCAARRREQVERERET